MPYEDLVCEALCFGWGDSLIKRLDPRGVPYYWIGGEAPTAVLEEGTDFWAISNGFVSITPVQLDLTAYALMDAVRAWKWK
jgi:5'-nucleotidase